MMRKLSILIKKIFPSSTIGKIAVWILLLWVLIAIFSPFLANDKPIIAKSDQGWSMPIFSANKINNTESYQFKINPLIPYRYDNLDLQSYLVPPFTKGEKGIHLLGTDKLGRDVAAGMINGARVALIVATVAIFLSAIFGIFIGLIIGFYGDTGIRRNLLQQLTIILFGILLIYYIIHIYMEQFSLYNLIPFILLLLSGYFIDKALGNLPFKKYGFPIDLFVQRLFEINESVPNIFIILAFVAIVVHTNLFTIPLILAVLVWMTFARYARAEVLQIKNEDYILSAQASGMSNLRILIKHILPNALPPLLVVMAFSFSGVILLESTLSFLGIGLPLEEVSWGKILAESRKSSKSWWLAVFPGFAIFLVLYAFNILGDILSNYQRNQETI
ncbi:MAG: ABC transporter permease [Saprospiraceae bacterium]|nr:ABC transporter permease [Saprospiraceae bacterium]